MMSELKNSSLKISIILLVWSFVSVNNTNSQIPESTHSSWNSQYFEIRSCITRNLLQFNKSLRRRQLPNPNDFVSPVNFTVGGIFEHPLNTKTNLTIGALYWKESYNMDPGSTQQGSMYELMHYVDKSIALSLGIRKTIVSKNNNFLRWGLSFNEMYQFYEKYKGDQRSFPRGEQWTHIHYGIRIGFDLIYEKRPANKNSNFIFNIGLYAPHIFYGVNSPRKVTGVNIQAGIAYHFEIGRVLEKHRN